MSQPNKQVAPTVRRKPPAAGMGRKKGSLNKTTASVKAALTEAFDKLGGVPSLMRWANENPDGFYAIWSKMLPKEMEVSGKDGERLGVVVLPAVVSK